MEDLINLVGEGLQRGDPVVIGVLIAVLVVALTILVFAVRGGANKRRGVLLLGLCDAGKSLLYSQLVLKKYSPTYTSIKENIGTYECVGKKVGSSVKLIDLPGHERIRLVTFDQYKASARAVIFVVDSQTFQKEIKDVADYLYSVLVDAVISCHVPRVLIACNKHDQTLAKGAGVIQTQLEKEMNTLRVTKSAALSGTDESSNNKTFLGKKNKSFSFSDLRPFRVDFVECSAKTGSGELSGVQEWLEMIA